MFKGVEEETMRKEREELRVFVEGFCSEAEVLGKTALLCASLGASSAYGDLSICGVVSLGMLVWSGTPKLDSLGCGPCLTLFPSIYAGWCTGAFCRSLVESYVRGIPISQRVAFHWRSRMFKVKTQLYSDWLAFRKPQSGAEARMPPFFLRLPL